MLTYLAVLENQEPETLIYLVLRKLFYLHRKVADGDRMRQEATEQGGENLALGVTIQGPDLGSERYINPFLAWHPQRPPCLPEAPFLKGLQINPTALETTLPECELSGDKAQQHSSTATQQHSTPLKKSVERIKFCPYDRRVSLANLLGLGTHCVFPNCGPHYSASKT